MHNFPMIHNIAKMNNIAVLQNIAIMNNNKILHDLVHVYRCGWVVYLGVCACHIMGVTVSARTRSYI